MSEMIDNRAERIRSLKQIIVQLHEGAAPDEVRRQMTEIVKQTDYSEIVAMEQELIAGGMPVEQVQRMCDLHSQVTRGLLVELPARPLPAGHPVETMRQENAALEAVLVRMEAATDGPQLRQALNELMDIEKHYQRKEHAFFSKLEAHGVFGPSKVMWGKDDEVRALLKQAAQSLDVSAAIAAVREMIYKENQILLPMCLDLLTAEDWAEIWQASPQYGWCLVEPGEEYKPVADGVLGGVQTVPGSITFHTGTLAFAQLAALFNTLPVDLTFVDADDRVAFFSEGPNRVFARSRAVVGRKVQHCHPPRSVAIVDQILADFRAGTQSVAEFWIQFQGRFVHIRYFAVRGEQKEYLGTLEVTQDVGPIRALEGERRLLEYTRPALVIRERIDGTALLERGVHPLAHVQAAAARLGEGEAVVLLSPFRPEPLITAMRDAGFEVESAETAPGNHQTTVARRVP